MTLPITDPTATAARLQRLERGIEALADSLDSEGAAARRPVRMDHPHVMEALTDAVKARELRRAAVRVRALLGEGSR